MTNAQDKNLTGQANPLVEGYKRILFIEDDETLVRAYQDKLTLEGFEVDSAIDGEEAIKKLKVNDYDLILLDLLLPEVTGFDVLKELRASKWPGAKKPVIVFSNLGNASDVTEARKLGANDYCLKVNLTPNQVVEKIKHQLGV